MCGCWLPWLSFYFDVSCRDQQVYIDKDDGDGVRRLRALCPGRMVKDVVNGHGLQRFDWVFPDDGLTVKAQLADVTANRVEVGSFGG